MCIKNPKKQKKKIFDNCEEGKHKAERSRKKKSAEEERNGSNFKVQNKEKLCDNASATRTPSWDCPQTICLFYFGNFLF